MNEKYLSVMRMTIDAIMELYEVPFAYAVLMLTEMNIIIDGNNITLEPK